MTDEKTSAHRGDLMSDHEFERGTTSGAVNVPYQLSS
jgi:hypothetical protein